MSLHFISLVIFSLSARLIFVRTSIAVSEDMFKKIKAVFNLLVDNKWCSGEGLDPHGKLCTRQTGLPSFFWCPFWQIHNHIYLLSVHESS